MTLENLIGISLERVVVDPVQISRLLAAARVGLRDAALPGLSAEARFDLAYKTIMQTANLGLLANGFRTLTSRPGHHQTMIQSLPKTIGLAVGTVQLLDSMRKQRHAIDYTGEEVSATMAEEVCRQAAALLRLVEIWLETHRPDLLTLP